MESLNHCLVWLHFECSMLVKSCTQPNLNVAQPQWFRNKLICYQHNEGNTIHTQRSVGWWFDLIFVHHIYLYTHFRMLPLQLFDALRTHTQTHSQTNCKQQIEATLNLHGCICVYQHQHLLLQRYTFIRKVSMISFIIAFHLISTNVMRANYSTLFAHKSIYLQWIPDPSFSTHKCTEYLFDEVLVFMQFGLCIFVYFVCVLDFWSVMYELKHFCCFLFTAMFSFDVDEFNVCVNVFILVNDFVLVFKQYFVTLKRDSRRNSNFFPILSTKNGFITNNLF